ncbi:MAG TPA: DNA repair protein RadC [Bacillales bacterium]|nr:DNA repair protein RadC [Bacillales bacterium]
MKKYIQTAREAVAQYQSTGIDLQHLLAVLIGPLATAETCGKLSSYGIRELADMTVGEFQNEGLSKIQAQRLCAAFETARKWFRSSLITTEGFHSPEAIYRHLRGKLAFEKQEHFYCMCLNTKNEVIHEETVFVGSLNASIVHPREVYAPAIKHYAASIAVAHNHPSNDPSPSREDVAITQRLREVGDMIGIELLDHLVISENDYISLKEKGYV